MAADIAMLWDFSDPAGSEARFREALEEVTGDERLELVTQVARALGLQQRFEEGHAELDAISGQVSGRARVRYLLECGRLFNSAGQPAEAVPLFLDAVAEAEVSGEVALEIDARHMLGIASPEPEQAQWTLSAIKRAESSDNPDAQRWLGSLLNNLGWTHHDAARYRDALDLFERSLAWHQEFGTLTSRRIARWSVARALRSLEEVEHALAMQLELAAELTTDRPDGLVLEEVAECLYALGRADEARTWFGRAFSELSSDPWLSRNEPDRLGRLERLSVDEE